MYSLNSYKYYNSWGILWNLQIPCKIILALEILYLVKVVRHYSNHAVYSYGEVLHKSSTFSLFFLFSHILPLYKIQYNCFFPPDFCSLKHSSNRCLNFVLSMLKEFSGSSLFFSLSFILSAAFILNCHISSF